ncbi:hypothetical protein ACXET9_01830 [Brachybacterium sp. DNPG3]
MARSYASVGQMTTYAVERSVQAPDLDLHRGDHSYVELLLRHMLEFVLMAPRSRDAFLRAYVHSDATTGSIVAEPRTRRRAPALTAEILPWSGHRDEGARLGIALRVGGPFTASDLAQLRRNLGGCPHGTMVTIVRRADLEAQQESLRRLPDSPSEARVVVTTWKHLSRRLAKSDAGHAHLWEAIAEIGEHAASPVVQYPVDPRRLLGDPDTAAELRAHLDVLLEAGRALYGAAPRFSTRRGQRDALLQVGGSRGRTALEFGEVSHGTPIRLAAPDEAPIPLGIGRITTPEERAEAEALLGVISRRTAWRTDVHALHSLPGCGSLIGMPASPGVENARLVLWAVLNPALLRDHGFELAPARRQPALTSRTLALRLVYREDPDTLYRIWVGGRSRWEAIIPRVTREATAHRPEETYAIAPRKGQSTADFVWEVHRALRSLTIPTTL